AITYGGVEAVVVGSHQIVCHVSGLFCCAAAIEVRARGGGECARAVYVRPASRWMARVLKPALLQARSRVLYAIGSPVLARKFANSCAVGRQPYAPTPAASRRARLCINSGLI